MLFIYGLTETIFLSAGLKYQATTVRINNNNDGHISFTESDAICENAAPGMAKKKPA